MFRPTFVEIDLGAIGENVRAVRRIVGSGVRIMPAVKADGYGHGAVQVSRAALMAGADMLGVASVEEAVELREADIDAPVLILGCSSEDSTGEIVERGISSTVCDLGFACALAAQAAKREKKAHVHIKVDTGMGRIGVAMENAVDLVTALLGLPTLEIEGIYTHFPSADEKDKSFTEEQTAAFRRILKELDGRGILPPLAHAANSGAVLDHPAAYFDMVRPGIMFYGLYPSPDSTRSAPLRPALTFKTNIVFLKDVPAGTSISYGRTFITSRPTKVATIAAGYADGYSRFLSNRGEVCVKGHRAPVIGRVCMDQTLIDVTDVPDPAVGDEVVLLGGGMDYTAVERVAELIGTIPHDVVCAIGKRVPRVYIGGN
ncbi:MAG: alanine racemase [Armatimonadetes bacterium]|nr:alanine racemase [Armatimonadota bacterium]